MKHNTREATSGDMAYIYSSWKKSYYDSATEESVRWGGLDAYAPNMHNRIDRIERGGAKYLISCDDTDQTFILGWVCHGPGNTLHYAHTRQSLQRAGVAAELCRQAGLKEPIACSHWTRTAAKIAKRKPDSLTYTRGALE